MIRDRLVSLLLPEPGGPMRYALDRRTFWFSHYLSTGLRTSSGILAVALGALLLLPNAHDVAMAMAFGAGCLALVDQTGPFHDKARELAVAALLNTLASLWIALLTGYPFLQTASVIAITFGSAFLLLYGKRAMPVQFSMLLAMTLALEHVDRRSDAIWITGGFLAGSMLYLAYALVVAWWQQQRSKQQVLAECLFELARYIDIKSGFYERKADIAHQFTTLIRQQVVLAEKQQAARDLVLQQRHAGAQDGKLIQLHLGMLDVYEQILSTHTDYQALHHHFGESDILIFLRDLVRKATTDVEAIAYAVTRDRRSQSPVSYIAEKRAIEFEIHLMQQRVHDAQLPKEALALLRSTYYKIVETLNRIHLLHAAMQVQQAALPQFNMRLFVSRPSINRTQLRHNLSLQSPIFRYGIRTSLAMLAGILAGAVVPYAAHAYWIMLTIAIIMKPSYSMTRERRSKRMIGTVLGCVLAAVVLHFIHSSLGLLLVLYLSLTISATFVQIRYVYTAAAATLTVMILLHFSGLGTGNGLVAERLLDTLVGVGIASVFSHVFPSWERQTMQHLLQRLFDAARAFMQQSHGLLLHDPTQDQAYRLARKQFWDQIATVNGALLRMLDEPRSRQRGVAQINQLLVRTYLMTSHVAALRMLLRRQPWLQGNAHFGQLVQSSMTQADAWLEQAQSEMQTATSEAANHAPGRPTHSAAPTIPVAGDALAKEHLTQSLPPSIHVASDGSSTTDGLDALLDETLLSGSEEHTRIVLQRRIAALQEDARQLVWHSREVTQAMGWRPASA